MTHDRFTGKPLDKPSDNLPEDLDEFCEFCGARLITKCVRCGAPVCCPRCCIEYHQYQSDIQAAAGGMIQVPLES